MATHLPIPTSTSKLSLVSLFSASLPLRCSPFRHTKSVPRPASSRYPFLAANAVLRRQTEQFSEESDSGEDEEEIDLEWMERDARVAVREYSRSLSRELTIGKTLCLQFCFLVWGF